MGPNGINWTQIIIAIVTTAGAVLTAVFGKKAVVAADDAKSHAENAKASADVATKASLRPGMDMGMDVRSEITPVDIKIVDK